MITNIPFSRIGKFETVAEGRTYQKALAVTQKVNETAAVLKTLDDDKSYDINSVSPGFVLVEGYRTTDTRSVGGYCKFDPKDGKVDKLDAKDSYLVRSGHGSQWRANEVKLSRTEDGTTTYQTVDGKVAIDPKGNLVYDDFKTV